MVSADIIIMHHHYYYKYVYLDGLEIMLQGFVTVILMPFIVARVMTILFYLVSNACTPETCTIVKMLILCAKDNLFYVRW